jgi:hypothetical protein
MIAELLSEFLFGVCCPGQDQKTAGIPIQPMNGPHSPAQASSQVLTLQEIDERWRQVSAGTSAELSHLVGVANGGEASRLFHDQNLRIAVSNGDLRGRIQGRRRRWGSPDQFLALPDASLSIHARHTIKKDLPGLQQALHFRV